MKNSKIEIKQFYNVPIEDLNLAKPFRTYSIVGDVIAYRLCPRQYGYFKVRNVVPSAQGQMFFGQVIHSVLDKAHLHFGHIPGTLPTEDEIDDYFDLVAKALKSQGIRPLSGGLERRARKLVKMFINKFGMILFPRVKDTEHKLQIQSTLDNGIDYILHGVVDVLLHQDIEQKREDENCVEIWDYKGGRIPESRYLEDYEFQMLVYSYLYKERNGYYPKEVILFFIGEIDQEQNEKLPAEKLMVKCMVKVKINEDKIKIAMKAFEDTVKLIEEEQQKAFEEQWLPSIYKPPKNMCATCDLRWSCPNPNGEYHLSGL
ncbi:MAG: PD-(D/E)XK nuclease family protein [Candidatus Heimdallarchaeaceae archaeon]